MKQPLKVFSHPRSGTNLLAALLKANFYPELDLGLPSAVWGHWANRVAMEPVPPYLKLFGGHQVQPAMRVPAVYIYRDGRAVAVSTWRSENFLHPEMAKLSFSEFLRTNLDWEGSPGFKADPGHTIVGSWYKHVGSWVPTTEVNVNLLAVCYETLVEAPELVLDDIASYFGLPRPDPFIRLEERVGPSTHEGKIDTWKKHFTDEDLEFFHQTVPKDCFYLRRTT